MAQKKDFLEVLKENEAELGKIKTDSKIFKEVRILYYLSNGDVEGASFVAVQSDDLWAFFKHALVNGGFNIDQKWIEKFCA